MLEAIKVKIKLPCPVSCPLCKSPPTSPHLNTTPIFLSTFVLFCRDPVLLSSPAHQYVGSAGCGERHTSPTLMAGPADTWAGTCHVTECALPSKIAGLPLAKLGGTWVPIDEPWDAPGLLLLLNSAIYLPQPFILPMSYRPTFKCQKKTTLAGSLVFNLLNTNIIIIFIAVIVVGWWGGRGQQLGRTGGRGSYQYCTLGEEAALVAAFVLASSYLSL